MSRLQALRRLHGCIIVVVNMTISLVSDTDAVRRRHLSHRWLCLHCPRGKSDSSLHRPVLHLNRPSEWNGVIEWCAPGERRRLCGSPPRAMASRALMHMDGQGRTSWEAVREN
ncbi:uncharacterized protein C8Q71DRAFT_749879, partial [Rhodofomes roseus]